MGIEFIAKDKVRIGPAMYRVFQHDPPIEGGRASGIDVAGSQNNGYQELLDIEQLNGITANQLPKGFGISIYKPRLTNKQIDSIEIWNAYGTPRLSLLISHYYRDWKHDSNPILLSKRLAADFLAALPGCVSARSDPDDLNVFITCLLDIPCTADLNEYITAIDSCVGNVIGKRLTFAGSPSANSRMLKPDEHGYKWWVRYVVIPLAGSAVLVTLLTWLLKTLA